jgi:anti-repressor protein
MVSNINDTSDESVETYTDPKFGTIRALSDEHGEPWFVAKDVCDVLGIRTDTIRKILEADEVAETNPNTIGVAGGHNPLIVNEPGLYRLIIKSRKPEAKAFQRWVTHEVLPSIRKHGGYMAGQERMTPEQMLAASMRWLESRIREQEETIASQSAQLEEQKPKVLFADAVSASDGTCLVGELAKMLTQAGCVTGQNRLFARLREDGYLGKSGQNRNVPLQRWVKQGLFRIKETAITHADGHVTINRTTKVTGRGQTYFLRRYAGIAKQASVEVRDEAR